MRTLIIFSLLLCGMPRVEEAPACLRGRVTTLVGDALTGASVRLTRSDTDASAKSSRTTTDGSFALERLEAGTWRMEVTLAGFARETRELVLEPGETKVLDLGLQVGRLTDTPGIRVSGVVRSDTGAGLAGASVVATAAFNSRLVYAARTAADGSYLVSIREPGQYVVVAYDTTHAVVATALMAMPLSCVVDFRLPTLTVQ